MTYDDVRRRNEGMNERYINGNHCTANIRDVNAQNMSNMLFYSLYIYMLHISNSILSIGSK